MNTISCLIQADSTAEQNQAHLEQRLRANHADQLDGAQVAVKWRPIEPGLWFTAGSPSTSARIGCTMDGPTTLDRRESYMRAICDFWTEVTGCTDHEIVVTITETDGASSTSTTGDRS